MAPRKKAEQAPKKEEVRKMTGTVTGGALYIRKGPGVDTQAVGALKDGEKIEIQEAGTDWHKIDRGYVMARWVKLDAGTN